MSLKGSERYRSSVRKLIDMSQWGGPYHPLQLALIRGLGRDHF
jgi:hypothetical protein